MEKSTITRNFRFQLRLLKPFILTFIYLAFLGTSGLAFSNKVDFSSLSITPEAQWFFTQTDSSFILKIPHTPPADVQISMPKMPDSVKFISYYKEEYLEEGNRGTSIRFWFSFSKPGEIKLNNITLKVNRRNYSLPFKTATVYDNPMVLVPQLHLEIKDSQGSTLLPNKDGKIFVYSGQNIFLNISVRYASRIFQFGWDLPENALFRELQRYPIVENQTETTTFSPKLEPVANFEWTPLNQGICNLPKIKITAVAYNGQRYELALPTFEIEALPQPIQKTETKVPPALEEAFSEPEEEVDTPEQQESTSVTAEKALKLANLRIAEIHSFPFSNEQKQRIAYETELNIGNTEKETSLPLAKMGFIFCLVCIIFAFILLFFIKKKKSSVIFFILSLGILIATIIYAYPLTQKVGIFVGGEVRIVPELNADSNIPIVKLSRVRIIEQTSEWYYIDLNGIGGWVPKTSVIQITKAKE